MNKKWRIVLAALLGILCSPVLVIVFLLFVAPYFVMTGRWVWEDKKEEEWQEKERSKEPNLPK